MQRGARGNTSGDMSTSGQTSTSTVVLAIAGAFAFGMLLAKCIDWIGHAHPQQ